MTDPNDLAALIMLSPMIVLIVAMNLAISSAGRQQCCDPRN